MLFCSNGNAHTVCAVTMCVYIHTFFTTERSWSAATVNTACQGNLSESHRFVSPALGWSSNHESPVHLWKRQIAPRLRFMTYWKPKKKEATWVCLSFTKVPHSHKTWAAVSSCAPYLKGRPINCIMYRCFLRELRPVRRLVAALDWVLLKENSFVLSARLSPEINSRA